MGLFTHFTHLNLTTDQSSALSGIETFLSDQNDFFILKGYAGSGKTTIVKGLANYLHEQGKHFKLIAPTGRAAKVLREKTDFETSTIHKAIYSFDFAIENKDDNSKVFYYKIRQDATSTERIFIVDESSMLSDVKNESELIRFGSGRLLSDLITFSRITNNRSGAKIIFIGDNCQLPPVGDNISKALDIDYLRDTFGISGSASEMTEVKRHDQDSGILKCASKLRKSITSGYFNDFRIPANNVDTFHLQGDQLIEKWKLASPKRIIIARKNSTCLNINLKVREDKFGNGDLPIQVSDLIVMGSNNYRKGVFNGEFAVVICRREKCIPINQSKRKKPGYADLESC